jgi:vacuolar-type H+-ATPase subunit D/Vma8
VTGRRVPPGRAGRLWLTGRLAAARRGAEVLDRKLQILRLEQQRLHRAVVASGQEWAACCADANTWLLRAALLSGQRGLQDAAADGVADVTLTWQVRAGVRYPAAADCVLPGPPAAGRAPGSSAVVHAETAHRAALVAAVRHATAQAAARILDAEVAVTRQRLRALTDRVIPDTEERLRLLVLDLEQSDHEDALRRRWAAERSRR